MKVQTRKRERRRSPRHYRFPGQDVGDRLAAWLNGPLDANWKSWSTQFLRRFGGSLSGNATQDAGARARAVELLGALQEMIHVHRLICAPSPHPPSAAELWFLENAEQRANAILRRYISYPQVCAPTWDATEGHFDYPRSGAFAWARGYLKGLLQEHWAVAWAIETLVRRGVLDRLRRCDICQHFFFAKRPDGLYCSPGCQAKRYDSPRYKKWRKEYDQNRKEDPNFRIRTLRRNP